MKFNETLTEVVENILEVNRIPMLIGEPGIGKSSWLEALAQRHKTQCFTLACNQLGDKSDLTGGRLVPINEEKTEYKQVFFPHHIIMDAIVYANEHPRQKPILFLDEINRTTSDVTSALLSIPTSRKIGDVKLPNNLRLVIAGNDKGNIVSLDQASVSRFVLLKTEPEAQTLMALIEDLHPVIKTALTNDPTLVFKKKMIVDTNEEEDVADMTLDDFESFLDSDDMSQITTPRTIEALSDWLNNTGNALLKKLMYEQGDNKSVLQEVIEGFTGETEFTAAVIILLVDYLTQNQTQQQGNMKGIMKPQMYDDWKKLQTQKEIEEFVSQLSPSEQSACLSYALYEKEDNERFIKAVSQQLTQFEKEDILAIVTANAHDQLDSKNVADLLDTKTPIANILSTLI